MKCRYCNTGLSHVFCDLQTCPPSNAMLKKEQLNQPEVYYPLKIYVCEKCKLVQVDEIEKAENLFNNEYTYFSSYSSTWLDHAKKYADQVIERFGLSPDSSVVEVASNDGYLLQFFTERNIPVLGIEPTANTAAVAINKGVRTIVEFFGSALASEQTSGHADLLVANNVLAHVPDINDFVKGINVTLKENGVATLEFPHLCRLIEHNQFDTIYHEHFSYLSLTTVKSIFEAHGMKLFDVEELSTHGGSLRVYFCKSSNIHFSISERARQLLKWESEAGVLKMSYYEGFQNKVDHIRDSLLTFLLSAREQGKKVVAYGAAAKGNTLINYAGIKGESLISFVVDASPHKQGKVLPGSRIPVVTEEKIKEFKPDYVIILPWNLKEEISGQLSYIREWEGKFVTFIPDQQEF